MQNEKWKRALAESRAWTREEAAGAVEACEASGMTIAAFARQHGATAGRLLYWRKRLREEGVTGGGRLLPVRVVEPGQARLVEREPGRTVLVEGRLRVELEGVPVEWVARLIRLLRESDG
jgi:transposase-like protein